MTMRSRGRAGAFHAGVRRSPAAKGERRAPAGTAAFGAGRAAGAFGSTRVALSRLFYQRCFWLFAMLLLLIGAVSFVPPSDNGRLLLNGVNMFLLIAAVAAVGRGTLSFAVALLLAIPAVVFQYLGLFRDDDAQLATSWMFSAALYFVTTAYLLRYVFQPRVMTQDKLFGAAAAYLMLGVLWAYVYALVGYFFPQSYLVAGEPGRLVYADAIYFSITVLTSTGFGDIVPFTRQARGICMVEQITGGLFVAILIARLAGVYPPRESYVDEGPGVSRS